MKKLRKILSLILVLMLCLGLFPASFASADSGAESGQLTVKTRTRSYVFDVGDEFTYSFWLHLVPDVANYAISYMPGYQEYAHALDDSKVEWLQGYVSYNDDYLTLESCSLPSLSSNKNTCRNVVATSSEAIIVQSFLHSSSAVFFDCMNFPEEEQIQFNNDNTVLVTCKFKVRHAEEELVGPVSVRTKMKQIKIQNDALITEKNPQGTFLVVDDGNTRLAYESYETVQCESKGIDEQPEVLLKSLVDDVGLDIRCELATQIIGGAEASMRPGAGVKVTLLGATADVRGYRQAQVTSGEQILWFYDVPFGEYVCKCSYGAPDGTRYGTKEIIDPDSTAEFISVPDTGAVQALWLFIEDEEQYTDIPVRIHWVDDEAYLPIRPHDLILRLVDPNYMSYSEQFTYVDTDEFAEDFYNDEYSFDFVPIYDENKDESGQTVYTKIDYDLVVANIPGKEVYTYDVQKHVDEETGKESFDVTFTYVGPKAKLNKIEKDPDGHYWVVAENQVEPTCTTPGRTYYICEVCHNCKYVKGEDAPGHLWSDDPDDPEGWKIIQELSCTDDEIQQRVCQRLSCRLVETKTTQTAIGHEWGEYVPNNDATCTDFGTMTAHCIHEGCKETDTVTNPDDKPTGHNWSDWAVKSKATCTDDIVEEAYCLNPGCMEKKEQILIDTALGHDWTEATLKSYSTCTEDEVYNHHCKRCGIDEDVVHEGTAEGHIWGDDPEGGPWEVLTPATCTSNRVEQRICTKCQHAEQRTIPDSATGHSWKDNDESGWMTKKAATCTSNEVQYRVCEFCGYTQTRTVENSATGHEWRNDPEAGWHTLAAEDCTNDRVEKRVCKDCGYTQTRTVKDSATGHSFTNYVPDGNATCKTDGTKTAHCDHKGCTVTNTVADVGSKELVAHDYSDYVSNGDATYDEDGTKTRVCAVCGHEDTVIDLNSALHHTYSNYVYNNDATCTERGTETAVCDEEECSATHTRVCLTSAGDPLGHLWSEYTYNEDATCTVDGTQTAHCLRDGCDATVTTPAVGSASHSWGDWVVSYKAPCTEKGRERRYCSVCGTYEEREYGPSGHNWGDWRVFTGDEPTCTEEGVETRWCDVCDEEETRPIPATGHNYVNGYCTECGERDPNYASGYHVQFTAEELHGGNEVFIDGVRYTADAEGCVVLDSPDCKLATVYTYNIVDIDAHNVYPTHMYVYSLRLLNRTYVVNALPGLTDVMQYAGSSIRLANDEKGMGIRMITSIPKNTRAALMAGGVEGYTLVSYGTVVGFDDTLLGEAARLGLSGTNSGKAYEIGSINAVYNDNGAVVQYTNVLVNFTDAHCSRDLSMRPFMVLQDANGNRVTLYGGILHRSIGFIAYQNRNSFTPGTQEYEAIWHIIHVVYGTTFDVDYRR